MRRLLAVTALLLAVALPPAVADAGSSTLASYRRTGGLAGVDVQLRVTPGGRAILAGGPTHRVRAATMRKLRAALDRAHLERGVPKPTTACADCFVYTLGYHGHRVRFLEAGVPKRLHDALTILGRIAAGGS